jgi:hypothetical protein
MILMVMMMMMMMMWQPMPPDWTPEIFTRPYV